MQQLNYLFVCLGIIDNLNCCKICEKCGLRRIKLHKLRHTNISILLETGASIKELQEWAGHSNYNITANIYSHVQESSKIKLSKALESALK